MAVSVVTPAINSASSLRALLERLDPIITSPATDREVILVNDANADAHHTIVTQATISNILPRKIPTLLAKLSEGYDVVYGVPWREQCAASRRLASKVTKLVLTTVMRLEGAQYVNAFRAFRTEFTALGIAVLSDVISRYMLHGTTLVGFPFLASTITIFSGAQLLAIGIVGEYLARIHFRTMAEPAHVVRSTPPED